MTRVTQLINRIAVAMLVTVSVSAFAAAPDAPDFLMHKASAKFKVSSQGTGEIITDTIKTQTVINLIMDRDLDAKSVKDEQLGLVTACAAAGEIEASALVVYDKKTDEVLSLPARAIIFEVEAEIIEFDKNNDPKKGDLLASIEDESVVDGFLTMSGSTNYGKIGKKVADGTWDPDAVCIKKFSSKSITGAGFLDTVVMSGKISGGKAQFAADEGIFPVAQMSILKTATSIDNPDGSDGGTTVTQIDDVINYAIDVTNTGGLQVTNVQVTDTNIILTCDGGLFDGVLDPGETVTCTGSNTVDVVEFAAACDLAGSTGSIHNIASVTSDETDSFAADEFVDVECVHAISTAKTATSISNGLDVVTAPDDIINYAIDVTNTASLQVTNVQVTDTNITLSCDGGLFDGVLDPGETVTCTGSNTVDAGEFAAACDPAGTGTIHNIATTTSDETNPVAASEIVDVKCFEFPGAGDVMSIVKTATSAQPVVIDDVIDYEIVAKNLTSLGLTGVVVTDTLLTNLDCRDSNGDPFNGSLLLQESVTCTGSHTVSFADVEFACDERNGTIRNIAAVTSSATNSFFADELVDVACP